MTTSIHTSAGAPRRTTADYVLTLSCPDAPGTVFVVAKFLVDHDCNIVESQQFDDRGDGQFFMRVQFEPLDNGQIDIDELRTSFDIIAQERSMAYRLIEAARKQRVLIMVSRFGHCLNDLLYRASNGSLNVEIPAVVSNHPDLAEMADNYRIPFIHIPSTKETKADAEAHLLKVVEDLDIDLVVLARYMQILSDDLCQALDGRAINIHHSMLPSFKGARPYHQAHERGVKLIGATAHYVTADLDEGPIIEQQMARIDHSMSAADVTEVGRDTECLALARAVHWHTDNRILLDGHRTVVFA